MRLAGPHHVLAALGQTPHSQSPKGQRATADSAQRPWDGLSGFERFTPRQAGLDAALAAAGARRGATAGASGDGNPCDQEQPCTPPAGPTTLFAKGAGDAHEVDLNDIRQGELSDCYFQAAAGALAQQDPDAIRNMIRDNGDGTYTVTFHQRDRNLGNGFGLWGDDWKPREVTVNGDLSPEAAHASGDTAGRNAEAWPQILEKAYAEYRGGYTRIDAGGSSSEAFEALTGRDATQTDASRYSFERLEADLRDGKAVTVSTPDTSDNPDTPKDESELPHLLVDWHGYVVRGTETDADGRRFVILHNPWGDKHPERVPIEAFGEQITSVNVVPTR